MDDALQLAAIATAVVYFAMVLRGRRRERELAQARAHEERLRGLTEISADWFWETDAEQRITWLSGGGPVALLFGNAPTFGKRFWEIEGIELDARSLAAVRERLRQQQSFFDLEISRTDTLGARQVHIVSGQARYEKRGGERDAVFLGYRGVGHDVTEQRAAERRLEAAKGRLELALDGGNLAEWHYDARRDELYAGDGWVRFLGDDRSPTVASGAQLERIIHPDDYERAQAALIRVLKGLDPAYDAEMRFRMKNGEWKWLWCRGRVTERDAVGRALRMSGVFSDIEAKKRAEAALREAEQRYRGVVDASPHGVIVHDANVIEYVNPAAVRMLKAASAAELVGRDLYTLMHPDELAEMRLRRRELLEKAPFATDFHERRMRCVDGSEIVVEAAGVSYYQNGRLVIQGLFRDVTETRATRLAAAEQDRRFRDVAAVSSEYVWEADTEWRFTFLSERAEAVLGYPRAELLGRSLWDLLPPGEERSLRASLAAHGAEGEAFRDCVHRVLTKSGAVLWQSLGGVPLHDAHGRWRGYRGTAADITARKLAESRIEQLVTRDALTGLANRALLAEHAGLALVNAARSRGQLALAVLDLDRFRLVNESLGHAAGDALLRAVAERLQNALRREDMLGRIGGDDFALLWNGVKSREEAAQLASRALQVFSRPFTLEGRALNIGASLGIALYPRDGHDVGGLLRHADAALHAAKAAGRGASRFFHPAMAARAADDLRVENELRAALTRNELVLHWQPVIRGRDEIVGAEALVRWQHPTRGLLGPEEFVPLAEQCGLIGAVGEWTLERAIAQAGAWQRDVGARMHAAPWFAVNICAPELEEGEAFVRKVRRSLEAHGLDGTRLELEVTERILMTNFEHHAGVLRALGGLGVRFAIDDFGTGYSSLAYLRQLPIDKLKIDRMFLKTLESHATDQAIVRTIVSLAHALGIGVAAEGVETEGQLEQLLALGCEQWQGRLASAPLDAQGLAALFASRAASAAMPRSSKA